MLKTVRLQKTAHLQEKQFNIYPVILQGHFILQYISVARVDRKCHFYTDLFNTV